MNEADFVINVAIPKRHHVADFSCALKNNFGCTYVDLLRENKFDQIEKDLDPSVHDPNIQSTLATMAASFPRERPISVKVGGINALRDRTSHAVNITLEYEFPRKWLLANVATKRSSEALTITGFHVGQIPESLERRNRFTLLGKTAYQYGALFLAITSVAVSLYAFEVCLKTPLGRKKWLWAIVSLLGGRVEVGETHA